jgi:sulfoxide reductase heme-binding subunit YedZ
MSALAASASDPQLMWITTRAAGTAAFVLASASMVAGLLLGGRMLAPRPGRALDLRTVHEALALGSLAALVLHAVTLLADPWLKPGLTDLLVPFAQSYRPLFTGIGVLAGYGLVLLGLTAYAKRWIGATRAKRLHRYVAVAWGLGVVHAAGAGTDAGAPWFVATLLACVAPVAVLLAVRLSAGRPAQAAA